MNEKINVVNWREERDIENPKGTVLRWLKECEEIGIKPWEYDFKYEIYENSILVEEMKDKPIELLLETWKDDKVYGYIKETEDSDLAQCIYKILWGFHSKNASKYKDDVDADVMNSFWYTFKYYLRSVDQVFVENGFNRDGPIKCDKGLGDDVTRGKFKDKYEGQFKLWEETLGISKNFWLSFILDNIDYFLYADKLKVASELKKYAALTHTIGNFTLVPKGYNSGRGGNDYWDYALEKMKNQDLSVFDGGFNHYIDNFHMSDYIKDDEVKPLMDQEKLRDKEKAKDEIESFLKKVNQNIEIRGKKMIEALLQKLQEEFEGEDKVFLESYEKTLRK